MLNRDNQPIGIYEVDRCSQHRRRRCRLKNRLKWPCFSNGDEDDTRTPIQYVESGLIFFICALLCVCDFPPGEYNILAANQQQRSVCVSTNKRTVASPTARWSAIDGCCLELNRFEWHIEVNVRNCYTWKMFGYS